MLTRDQIREFHEKGYLCGDRKVSDVNLEILRQELERVIEDRDKDTPQPVSLCNLTGRDDSPIWQIVNIYEASQAFHDLVYNQAILEEVAQLTAARELRVWHDQIQYKPAQKGGINMWHQDAPLWPIIEPPTQVTAWVALDDVDESNGCMSMVPGSHHWGDQMAYLNTIPDFKSLPKEFNGNPVRVELRPVEKGCVHYHHALTWHGSHENSSGRPRRAIAIHYMTDETYYIASGEHLMKPFVQVADGERLVGDRFPLVWSCR